MNLNASQCVCTDTIPVWCNTLGLRPAFCAKANFSPNRPISPLSYLDLGSVERTPDAPDALVDARNWLARNPLVLLRARVPQELHLLPYALGGQVLHVHRFLVTIEVVCGDGRVVTALPVDLNLNLRVALREGTKLALEIGIHAA